MQVLELKNLGQHSFKITVKAIQRVLAATGVNLAMPFVPDASGQPVLLRLHHDPALLLSILWILFQDSLTPTAVTEDAFYEIMQGELFADAKSKFHAELTDFFRRLNQTETTEGLETMAAVFPQVMSAAINQVKALTQSVLSTTGPVSSASILRT